MGRFLYKAMHDDNWGEHELDYVIVMRDCDVKEIKPNPEEVEAIAVVASMDELIEIVKSTLSTFTANNINSVVMCFLLTLYY